VLRWRLISAAVIIALLLAAMGLDYRLVLFGTPGAWLLPVLLLVSTLATEESLSLLRAKQHDLVAWPVYLGNLLIPLLAAWPIVRALFGPPLELPTRPDLALVQFPTDPAWALAILAMILVLVLLAEMQRFRQPGHAIVNAALALFVVLYIGVLISFWALLRLHFSNARGMVALVSMLVIVKMADTGAFAFGKSFGRHKLTPILSPGKTWEGAIGGILTACFTSWLFFAFAAPAIIGSTSRPPSPIASIAYGLALAQAGMVGDLAESLFKRDMQRKDSSTWLRGLGGVLDIIDAPLVAGPIAWLCWTTGLIHA
jgi:phosphatidate cytidylyltransferase